MVVNGKKIYGQFLQQFILHKVFPQDIEHELKQSLQNPAATSCVEDGLLRILRKYDKNNNNHRLVEEIAPQSMFKTPDGRVFQKGVQLRKRFKCVEVKTGRVYLFSPVYEVISLAN